MCKKTIFRLLILLPICLFFFSNCTQDFSFQYNFKLKDEIGNSISGANVYLATSRMYPVVPWWWTNGQWEDTLNIQREFKSLSHNDGTVTVSILKHRTFYSEDDFFLIVHKEGYLTAIIPFTALCPNVILYRDDSKITANNKFTLIKGDVFNSAIYYHRTPYLSEQEYHRILLYKPFASRISRIIQRNKLELQSYASPSN